MDTMGLPTWMWTIWNLASWTQLPLLFEFMKMQNQKSGLDSAFRIWAAFMWLTVGFCGGALSQNQNLLEIIPGIGEGNSYSTIPFTGSDSVRFQQVYGAGGFTALGISGPFLIQHL